jgi:threonine/homoserine/homoserine lactone efflux protein
MRIRFGPYPADFRNLKTMPSIAALLSYVIASFLIVIVPGPTVTVIIGNSLRHGARAGLLNVVGTQIGLLTMIGVLVLGLSAAVSTMGSAFEILRLVGAVYLVWLGYRMWRSDGSLAESAGASRPGGSYLLQGFIVIWSNPKALLFFGAFIPQFVDPARGNTTLQIALLGAIFMLIAAIFDGLYAIAAGNARGWLSRARIRMTERIAGTFLIAGGLWLAFGRR